MSQIHLFQFCGEGEVFDPEIRQCVLPEIASCTRNLKNNDDIIIRQLKISDSV